MQIPPPEIARDHVWSSPESRITRCAAGGEESGRKPQDIRHVQEAEPVPEPLSLATSRLRASPPSQLLTLLSASRSPDRIPPRPSSARAR